MTYEGKRAFSYLYDSVEQRELIGYDADRAEELYGKFVGIMRWDLLMLGRITVTDAMWYDGTVFAKMIKYGNFDEFIRFLSKSRKYKPLVVRRRENYAAEMFCKRFHFSSVDSGLLCSLLEEAGSRFGGKTLLKHKPYSLDACLKNLSGYLNCSRTQKELHFTRERIESELVAFTTRMGKLNQDRDDPGMESFSTKDAPAIDRSTFARARKALVSVFGDIQEGTKGYEQIKLIKEELEKEYPSRSKVVSYLRGVQAEYWPGSLKDVLKALLEDYNRGLAKQHGCNYVDWDVALAEEYLRGQMEEGRVMPTVLDELTAMTWDGFCGLYCDRTLSGLRESWLSAYDESEASERLTLYLNGLLPWFPKAYGIVLANTVFYIDDGVHRLAPATKINKDDEVIIGEDASGGDICGKRDDLKVFARSEEGGVALDSLHCWPDDPKIFDEIVRFANCCLRQAQGEGAGSRSQSRK